MKCDGAVLSGAMTVTIDPIEACSVDEAEVTFVQAGEVTIQLRGAYGRVEETVTVQ